MREKGKKLYRGKPTGLDNLSGNVSLPLVMDTEFVTLRERMLHQVNRTHLTSQITGIKSGPELILQNPDLEIQSYSNVQSECHAIDYLRHCGYPVELKRVDSFPKNTPRLQIVLYAHFALAEINMVFSGQMRDDLLEMQRRQPGKEPYIEMRRRLVARTGDGPKGQDFVPLPYQLTIDGRVFALELSIVDTGAILGIRSYQEFCQVAAVDLPWKDLIGPELKGRMDLVMEAQAQIFELYSKGDLKVYPALEGWADKMKMVYRALDVEEYYSGEPALTIGSTIAKLIEAKNLKLLGVHPGDREGKKAVSQDYLKPASASELRTRSNSTAALLAKVEGGRCTNNRPTLARTCGVNGLLIDLDINGCYGEGQRVQLYPYGRPEVVSYPLKSERNRYWTLKEFLKVYKGELVPGLWFARITTERPLKYDQDFFASWVVPSSTDLQKMARLTIDSPSDTELQSEDTVFNEERGNLKILTREIYNGTLTHDGLQFIMEVCPARIRNEFLDNLLITAATVYPASLRCQSVNELKQKHLAHEKSNRVIRPDDQIHRVDGEFHGWYAVPLGEHFIDELLGNRKLYPKKTAENETFKLGVNTSYGDMTSKYFELANTCVGNNITARARALAFYMEKGLIGFQTVTDGCVCDPNRVLYCLGKEINPGHLTAIGTLTNKGIKQISKKKLKVGPLGGYDSIEVRWPELAGDDGKLVPKIRLLAWKDGKTVVDLPPSIKDGKISEPAREWINRVSMDHLRALFPRVDVLHAPSTRLLVDVTASKPGEPAISYTGRTGQFEFEIKDVYQFGTFHGSANYWLKHPDPKSNKIAMRSYENKKKHQAIEACGETVIPTDRYDEISPAQTLHDAIAKDPRRVPRASAFIKTSLVKPGLYRSQKRFQEAGLMPGDEYLQVGLLREFSLSQFKFQTFDQWRAWEKWYVRTKKKYGQSCEEWYLNHDGTLDYQQMIEEVYQLIRDGRDDPGAIFHAKSKHGIHRSHPALIAYNTAKNLLWPNSAETPNRDRNLVD